MSGVLILFAFAMSVIIKLVEKKVSHNEFFNDAHEVKENEAVKEVE
jgi:hypothetical protein